MGQHTSHRSQIEEDDHIELMAEPIETPVAANSHPKLCRLSFAMVSTLAAVTFVASIYRPISAYEPLPDKPHLLMFLADDLGWADVDWHREDGYPERATPGLDHLRREGIELHRTFAFKYCAPSRAALLSGRHPIHVTVLNSDPGTHNPSDDDTGFAGIARSMTTLATVLKRSGYRTHHVGKWDVGMATFDHTPHGRGFDSSLGFFSHENDYYNFTVDDNFGAGPRSCVTTHTNGVTAAQLYAQAFAASHGILDLWEKEMDGREGPAFEWINSPGCDAGHAAHPDGEYIRTSARCVYEEAIFEERAQRILMTHDVRTPLFLYHAFHLVHEPLQVPAAWLERFEWVQPQSRRRYLAMASYMDHVVVNLTALLRTRGMWSRSLVVFASDNGGPIYRQGSAGANNFPLRGGKASNLEGGIRVPAIVSGGYLPPSRRGLRLEGLVALWDFYATFAALAGIANVSQRSPTQQNNNPLGEALGPKPKE